MTRTKKHNLRRLCVIAGPLVLLFAWLSQTFFFDKWNSDLDKLNAARLSWDVYRSNHYAMNAMRPEGGFHLNQGKHDQVIRWQEKNLSVANARVRSAVSETTYERAQKDVEESWEKIPRGESEENDTQMAISIEIVKIAIKRESTELLAKKQIAQNIFWIIYILGSLITVAATILKEHLDASAPLIEQPGSA